MVQRAVPEALVATFTADAEEQLERAVYFLVLAVQQQSVPEHIDSHDLLSVITHLTECLFAYCGTALDMLAYSISSIADSMQQQLYRQFPANEVCCSACGLLLTSGSRSLSHRLRSCLRRCSLNLLQRLCCWPSHLSPTA